MPGTAIAHVNIARMRWTYEAAEMADFIARLDQVNRLAEAHRGFIWRWKEEGRDPATAPFSPDWLVNMSVWRSIEDLREFTYSGDHLAVMKKRGSWFEKWPEATMALWPVAADHHPDEQEAHDRLMQLRRDGASAEVFTFAGPPVRTPG